MSLPLPSRVYPLTHQADWAGPKPIDLIQHAGETVYVPNGWWHAGTRSHPIEEYIWSCLSTMLTRSRWAHAVMNLEETIAVTQNFCNTTNFPRVRAPPPRNPRGNKITQTC